MGAWYHCKKNATKRNRERVEIDKDDGGKRLLGILTVRERNVQ
jgi:hypothetical protein